MKAIPKTDYQRCFAEWKKKWLKCIAANGDYFEGDNLNLSLLAGILDQAHGSTLLQVVETLIQLCSISPQATEGLYDKVVRLATGVNDAHVPILVQPQAFLLWSHLLPNKPDGRWSELLLDMAQPHQPAETRTLAARALTPGLSGATNLDPMNLLSDTTHFAIYEKNVDRVLCRRGDGDGVILEVHREDPGLKVLGPPDDGERL
ncbi:hypothetical protein LAZ67_22000706 [Cordylochernes scorpioides]|uniref:Uncharacterized protein n=1 Tax=Cordylochernes scorpioides TaxID=51811 RepID=A0ABY6LNJ1_9ARAC|nr:hypothetical protein LAZ67_22000706 [Cordylochernes scorpioides]